MSSVICGKSMIARIAPISPQLILCFIAERVLRPAEVLLSSAQAL